MQKAIITGATGLVGSEIAKYFSSLGIEVLCLGRQTLSKENVIHNFGKNSSYLRLSMEDIQSLAKQIALINWSPGSECVFFNFAWQGYKKLTDGSFEEQLNNAIHSAEAVRTAKKLGCIKFVNVGTIEETMIEQFIDSNCDDPYHSNQTDYALAKLTSRDMCKMIAYLEKINYVHTRLSVPLVRDLSMGTYIATTLKKIAEGKPYDEPLNKQLFDIIFMEDVAYAYYLIGVRGKNKADYFIGTSKPATLGQYFEKFSHLVNGNYSDKISIDIATNNSEFFNTELLYNDTGFVVSSKFEDIVKNL
jgi:nucleoside-diphosphate-sugar epimerase